MTLLTGVGGGRWNELDNALNPENIVSRMFGDLPDDLKKVIREDDAAIRNAEQINRVLEREIESVRLHGVSERTVVAVESVKPGLIDERTRMFATTVPTKTGAERTLVALESAQKAGKFALIALIIGAVLKIISWILDNGSDGSYAQGDIDGFNDSIEEVNNGDHGSIPDIVKEKLDNLSPMLKAAAIEVYKDVGEDKAKIAAASQGIGELSKLIKAGMPLEKLFEAIGAMHKGNPLKIILSKYVESPGDETIVTQTINAFSKYHVLDLFYSSDVVYAMLQHAAVKHTIAKGRRLPTREMWTETENILITALKMTNACEEVLSDPSPESGQELREQFKDFVHIHLDEHVVEEQRMSHGMYNTPLTRKREESGMEGYNSLGDKILALNTSGSITGEAMKSITSDLNDLTSPKLYAYLDDFAKKVTKDAKRFGGQVVIKTDSIKTAKVRLEKYEKTIKGRKGGGGKHGDEDINRSTAVDAKHLNTSNIGLKDVNGNPVTAIDMITDHAKLLRSVYTTYAVLKRKVNSHNRHCDIMSNLAKAK